MHPDDKSPYLSREQLFETIRWQRVEIDNLHERIRSLQSRNEPVGLEYPEADWDRYAETLPP